MSEAAPLILRPIGFIETPFTDPRGMPIQPVGAATVCGRVVLDPRYSAGLDDLEGFSHLILIYHFHRSQGYRLKVTPFMDTVQRGVFATRAPRRPNPLGLSVVRLLARKGTILEVRGLDVLDKTPLLDLKPFVPAFDAPEVESIGWLATHGPEAAATRSDERFQTED